MLDIDFLFFGGFFGVLVVFFGGLFSFFVVGGGDFKEIIGLFGQLLFGGGEGFFFSFFGLVVNVDIQFVVFKKGLLYVYVSVIYVFFEGIFVNYVREKIDCMNNCNIQCKILYE